ncbi:MAG: heavy-metal-associated domain-containing protein [Terriglobia bacterium]
MRRLDGVGDVKVDLKSGQAVLTPQPARSFDPTKIAKAVKDAGFSPGPIEVTAVGTLKSQDELLLLEMPGPVGQFLLAGGDKAEELKKRQDLLNRRLRVRGTLHPYHADRPPGLKVEWYEIPATAAPATPEPAPGKTVTRRGKLTPEGVECQAFRTTDGVVYTLVGDLKGFKAGDQACVTGSVAEVSICMQGITLAVKRISKTCD